MRSDNPVLTDKVWQRAGAITSTGTMTVQGTVAKTAVLVLLTIFAASWTWRAVLAGNFGVVMPSFFIGLGGGLVVAIVTTFRPALSPYTGPLYAVLKGMLLGSLSAIMALRFGPDLPMLAVGLTIATLLGMLFLYRMRIIKVTERFRSVVVSATVGVMLFYLVTIVSGFLGFRMPLVHDAGMLGIGFSLFVVGLAALNLTLDFDLIERGAAGGAPKVMEWYGAFALIVTLIWLYIELLRLLGKLRR
jgi:uncharacterized YccA/Bax inhibitor family protein